MDLLNQIGISYIANYLLQGNQLEKCKNSTKLQAFYTELKMRSDGKDFDITNIKKNYKGNVVFHLPSINVNLNNLNKIAANVRKLIDNGIQMVTIDASNLSLDLFEWSTVEEQKKYFLNMVTGVATLASNKIIVAVENTHNENNTFGYNISQVTDLVVYARRLLVKDFGFSEEEAKHYVGISLNINSIIKNENIDSIDKWFKITKDNLKCIKFKKIKEDYESLLQKIFELCIDNNLECPIFFQTKSEMEEVNEEYTYIIKFIKNLLKEKDIKPGTFKIKSNASAGFSNILILSIIALTIGAAVFMFLIKIRQ